ncbi:hypothetical protein EIP91_009833 [Steccherinum ochraceum]|uniref:Uncharacterized protein n=1 Tax=Steccherinum ochraceum TaxID=92696 RepID=A0A4R0RAI4_9APHY|nr:hypothetical protein EIP91_009833 [Steccherinum ochraceum]
MTSERQKGIEASLVAPSKRKSSRSLARSISFCFAMHPSAQLNFAFGHRPKVEQRPYLVIVRVAGVCLSAFFEAYGDRALIIWVHLSGASSPHSTYLASPRSSYLIAHPYTPTTGCLTQIAVAKAL